MTTEVTFGTPESASGTGTSASVALTGLTPGQPVALIISSDAVSGDMFFPTGLSDTNAMEWTLVDSGYDSTESVRYILAFIGTGGNGATSTTISAGFGSSVPWTMQAVGCNDASQLSGLACIDSVGPGITGTASTIPGPVFTPNSTTGGAVFAARCGTTVTGFSGSGTWTTDFSGSAGLSLSSAPPESPFSVAFDAAGSTVYVSIGFVIKADIVAATGSASIAISASADYAITFEDLPTGEATVDISATITTSGGQAPSSVPWKFPVAINDHPYVLDLTKTRITTMQVRRQSGDDSVEPGEQTLSAAGIWPRAQDNFFLGAGQEFLDNRFAFESVYVHSGEYPSVRTRFWKSQGVNPWNEGKMTLLPEYASMATSSSNLLIVVCGVYLYRTDGAHLYYMPINTPLDEVWTEVTSANTTTIVSLTSDGSRVWFATGTDGVYVTSAGTTTSTAAATPAALNGIGGVIASVAAAGTVNATNLPNGTVNYYITEVDAFGNETEAVEVSPTVTGTPINLSWNPDTNASNFNVRRNIGGSDLLIYTGDVPSFVDDGTVAGTVSAHPTSNATGSTPYEATWIMYSKGHLIASTGRDLVEILASGNVTFIYQDENPNFVFTCGCEMPTAIIVAGYAGGLSFVGAIQPDSATNGSTLAPPTWATALPYGESIYALAYNAGSILLGTSLGVRTGTDANSNGIFSINPVIEDPGPVYCTAAWAQYQYFGWSNYDPVEPWASARSAISGLGRADLSQYTTPGVAAYATDVMGASVGTTTQVVVMDGVPYFVVNDAGAYSLYGPDGKVVAEGWFEPGWVRYGTLESKIVVEVDFQHEPLPAGASVGYQIVYEDTTTVNDIGVNAVAGSTTLTEPIEAGLMVGDRFMPVVTLSAATGQASGPVFLSHITKAMVTTQRQDEILLCIRLDEQEATLGPGEEDAYFNTFLEYTFLKGLEGTGQVVTLKMGNYVRSCYIDQCQFTPENVNDQRDWFHGEVICKLVSLNTN